MLDLRIHDEARILYPRFARASLNSRAQVLELRRGAGHLVELGHFSHVLVWRTFSSGECFSFEGEARTTSECDLGPSRQTCRYDP